MIETTNAFPSATAPLYFETISSADARLSSSISIVTSALEAELDIRALEMGAGAKADCYQLSPYVGSRSV